MKQSKPAADAVNALKCELAGEVLRSSGKLRLPSTGRSMLPTILPGDTLLIDRVLIDRTNRDTVTAGDIVLFSRNQRLFAHRVIQKSGDSQDIRIVTQGDGLPDPDFPVNSSELMGKVAFIVRNGKCIAPSARQSFGQRAVSALVRRSESAARIIVGIHGMRRSATSQQDTACQS